MQHQVLVVILFYTGEYLHEENSDNESILLYRKFHYKILDILVYHKYIQFHFSRIGFRIFLFFVSLTIFSLFINLLTLLLLPGDPCFRFTKVSLLELLLPILVKKNEAEKIRERNGLNIGYQCFSCKRQLLYTIHSLFIIHDTSNVFAHYNMDYITHCYRIRNNVYKANDMSIILNNIVRI